jgi:hypothetical protein
VDGVIFQHFTPVGVVTVITIAFGGFGGGFFVTATDGYQTRNRHRGIHHVGEFLEGVGVRLAHESIAQHANADFGRVTLGACARH